MTGPEIEIGLDSYVQAARRDRFEWIQVYVAVRIAWHTDSDQGDSVFFIHIVRA
jgi:hypothetical protein